MINYHDNIYKTPMQIDILVTHTCIVNDDNHEYCSLNCHWIEYTQNWGKCKYFGNHTPHPDNAILSQMSDVPEFKRKMSCIYAENDYKEMNGEDD